MPNYLPIAGGRITGFIHFPRVLVLCEMQSASSRIWTRVAVFISYDDNYYTTGTCWWSLNLLENNVLTLNFWEKVSCAIFFEWFFGLLTSSLLLVVVTQGLGRCAEMIQPKKSFEKFDCWTNKALLDQQSNFRNDFPGWIITISR